MGELKGQVLGCLKALLSIFSQHSLYDFIEVRWVASQKAVQGRWCVMDDFQQSLAHVFTFKG